MKNDLYDIKQNLSKTDLFFLKNIYLLRCLTIKQAYNSFYKDSISNISKFVDTKLNKLIKENLIEEVLFNRDYIALFLTKKGVDLVKEYYNIPIEIFDKKTKKITKGYYTAAQLKMSPRLIPHQVHLNQFILDFQDIYNYKKMKFNYEYFDEKYVSKYFSIRPDGLINFLGVDLFLEMDMSSESKVQLLDKWKHYRTFLTSNNYLNNPKKIIVFFIIENTNNLDNRKKIVKSTATQILLDLFNDNFEIVIGSKNELLLKLFNDIIPSIQQTNSKIEELKSILQINHKFNVSNAYPLKHSLNNSDYEFYVRKIDKENNIVVENGVLQEYFLDYFIPDSLSVINRIAYNSQNANVFKYHCKRDFKYIVVVEDIKKIYEELYLYDLTTEKNVYYTTIDRLKNFKFYEALIQFDSLGKAYSFINPQLINRNYLNIL